MGKRLSEDKLSISLSANKPMLQEVLRRLHREGLVTIRPQQGVFVFSISKEVMQRLLSFKSAMEIQAMKESVRFNHRRLTKRLSTVVDILTICNSRKEFTGCFHYEAVFYDTLFIWCGNKHLKKSYEIIAPRLSAIRHLKGRNTEYINLSNNQCQRIVQAISEKSYSVAFRELESPVIGECIKG